MLKNKRLWKLLLPIGLCAVEFTVMACYLYPKARSGELLSVRHASENLSGILGQSVVTFLFTATLLILFALHLKKDFARQMYLRLEGKYFYPKPVQEKVYELGLTDRKTVAKKRKRFMTAFFGVMTAALILIIRVWNGVHSFLPTYLQALLFLEVMNWYDGIVIDRLWVGHSRFWVIPGTEEILFVQTWPQVLKKRGILTLIWIAGAAIVAGIIVLLF